MDEDWKRRFSEALAAQHQPIEAVSSRVAADFDGADYVCKTRCWECCSSYFPVETVEAIRVWEGFRQLPPDVQARCLAKAREVAAALEERQDALDRWLDEPLGLARDVEPGAPTRTGGERFFIQCPLLSDDGFCLVYEHRPLTCHAYGPPRRIVGRPEGDVDHCYKNFTVHGQGAGFRAEQVLDYQAVVRARDALEHALYREVLGRDVGFTFRARLAEWLVIGLDDVDWRAFLTERLSPARCALDFIRHICPRDVFERVQQDAALFDEIVAWHAEAGRDEAVAAQLEAVFDQLEELLESGRKPQYAAIRRVCAERGLQFLGYVVLNIGQRYLAGR